jgi:type I restriction enzyme S subunit
MSPEVGFKQTDIGEIPADWEVIRLGDEKAGFAHLIMGQSPPSSTYNEAGEGLPFLQGNADFGERYPVTRTYTSKPLKIAQRDDILVSVRAPVGELNLSSTTCCIGRGLAAIRPNPTKLDNLFVFYYLKYTIGRLLALASGSTFTAVRKIDLERFPIPLPQIAEQRKIASVISEVDNEIHYTDGIIAKTQLLKNGLMQQLLTKGVGHRNFKQTVIGEIPESWSLVPCEEICTQITVGIVSSATPHYVERGVPFLRSQNIKEYGIDSTDLLYISEEFNQNHKKSILRQGDVVTVRTGEPGTSCVVPEEYDGSNCFSLIVSRPSQIVLSHYLSYYINSGHAREFIASRKMGGVQQNFNVGFMKKLPVPLPSLDEQQKIISVLFAVDDKMRKERQKKKQLEQLKCGLMQHLLTGKVRVKVN